MLRRTVDRRAKQKQTEWLACQTHNRVQLWEVRGHRESVVGRAVTRSGGHVVQKSFWNGFDLVQSSTEDKLLLELEQDIPNAILDLHARGAGTAPFQLTRERRRRNLSIQKCV